MPNLESPLAEITLRKYEKPYALQGRELVKKLCFSIGLLQPGDSRDVIVDILHVLITTQNALTSKQVETKVIENRNTHKLPRIGITSANIRRQIKRLRNLYIIDKSRTSYHVAENATLREIFEEKVESYLLRTILDRVKEYLDATMRLRSDDIRAP
jgi:hypothetical protein